ncbi:MAG: phosphopantetheine-binding protein [Candidatus Neomarinimicrobiota bacterium]
MKREDGLAIIRSAVAESLALDVDQVTSSSRLVSDLGMDSLDFIEIIFILEKEFSIKIREEELNFLSRLSTSATDISPDGYLTTEAIDQLRPQFPAMDELEDLTKVTPAQLFSLITLETLWLIVEKKIGGL